MSFNLKPSTSWCNLIYQYYFDSLFTLDETHETMHPERGMNSHLSPYTRWRFLEGLLPGVTSLFLPTSSNSFMIALLSLFGSRESGLVDLSLRATFSSFDFLSDFRFSIARGVAEWGGVSAAGELSTFEVSVGCA
jgi:hypothetical protein